MGSLKFKQTEIGEIPTEWEVERLGDLGELKNGVNFNRNDFGEGFPIINVTNLFRGKYATINNLSEIKKETLKNPENYFVIKGDLLFARSSLKHSGTGQAAMVFNLSTEQTVFSGFIIRFRKNLDTNINDEFLNYLVRSNIYREYIRRSMDGTTITNINQTFLSSIPIILPSLPEQLAIAQILSSLDAKIELNNQMNKTLEAIGQAIFKKWFIEGEKDYWEIKSLSEIANYLNGLALQKFPPKGDNNLSVIKIRELKNGITENTDRANSDLPKEYIINNGDILFSWSGSLEVVIWAGGKGALNQHLFKVTSEKYPKWFFYYWTLNHLQEFKMIAEGKATTMGHIKRHHLDDAKCLVPDEKTLEKMSKVMKPLIEMQIKNMIEKRTLSQIRDALLPKLMSGEVRVK